MSSLGKNASCCYSDEDAELRRGPWTLEEDTLLIHYVSSHGEGRWNLLSKLSGLRRTGKSCRLRWLNYLKPDVKRGNLTPQEQLLILELQFKLGNRWSKIAQHLPGRTDNEIKNYWRTRVQKQAQRLKIDSNSNAFQQLVRCCWIPRLLQKVQHSSPSPGMLSQNMAATIHQPRISLSPRAQVDTSESLSYSSSTTVPTSESMTNISHVPQLSDYPPASLFQPIGNSDYNIFQKDCYEMSIAYPVAVAPPAPGDFEDPNGGCCYASQNNWIGTSNVADTLWTIPWQFRQLQ